ncbi:MULTISPECIES: phage tail protein [Nocardia]|uniref:Phage tail protein n=1 Tax=Nocardia sputorum TaxID=2984338 RepID=A0ABN6U7C6_9NOCA|nr:phage tail protein [Nocardia sputorum]BDU01028.1 hypothetical protein IFM12276_40560 [Nocardia sputorum]
MSEPTFVHLNRDNVWRDFHRRGLDPTQTTLRLATLPAATTPPPTGPPSGPDASAGLAVGPDGTIFFTDGHTIGRVDGCDGSSEAFSCVGGEGSEPTELRGPTGLLVHRNRGALIVADTGNDRIQLFDLRTHQLLDVWDGFDRPSGLAADPAGRIYVAEHGRVRQLTAGGAENRAFADTLAAEAVLRDPVAIAVRPGPEICVLDRSRRALLVLDPAGHLLTEHNLDLTDDPLGLAATSDAFYIGAGGSVVTFDRNGTRLGIAAGWSAPVAALALDGRGGLIVHPGGSGPPVRLALHGAFVRHGIAWGGPFGGFTDRPKTWHRLVTTMVTLPADAHVQFFVHTTNDPASEPAVEETAADPFPAPAWSPGPPELGEFLIDRPATRFAWVGIRFTGDGTSTAELQQIRLEFDHAGYLQHLPAIYRDEQPHTFLRRYLALVESLFGEVQDATTGLSRLLDPAVAEPFLTTLARWLAVDRAPQWDTGALREAVTHSYAESAHRGTPAGLRQALRRHTGVDAWIEEPIVTGAWWALAAGETSPAAERETSVLGVTTMLAAAEPQGAVLGSTATVDRSHLIDNAEYGMPLFDTVAHRFTVRLYQGANYSAERAAAVEALLERERPAHTDYVICRVDPGLAVGTARVGIDTVIGGDAPPARLDGEAVLGAGFVLGGAPPGRIGESSQLGVTTLLGSGSLRDH